MRRDEASARSPRNGQLGTGREGVMAFAKTAWSVVVGGREAAGATAPHGRSGAPTNHRWSRRPSVGSLRQAMSAAVGVLTVEVRGFVADNVKTELAWGDRRATLTVAVRFLSACAGHEAETSFWFEEGGRRSGDASDRLGRGARAKRVRLRGRPGAGASAPQWRGLGSEHRHG